MDDDGGALPLEGELRQKVHGEVTVPAIAGIAVHMGLDHIVAHLRHRDGDPVVEHARSGQLPTQTARDCPIHVSRRGVGKELDFLVAVVKIAVGDNLHWVARIGILKQE